MIIEYACSADCVVFCFALDFPTSLENIKDKVRRNSPKISVLVNSSVSGLTGFRHASFLCRYYSWDARATLGITRIP